MSHRASFGVAFNGGRVQREPTLTERIALTLMEVERRECVSRPSQYVEPSRPRRFTWETEA